MHDSLAWSILARMSAPVAPFVLSPHFSPRPWGTHDLSAWFSTSNAAIVSAAKLIGESWLTGNHCRILTGNFAGLTLAGIMAASGAEILGQPNLHSTSATVASFPEFPLLIKFIFPHDKLSVQVHPDDALAQAAGHPRGKTECWYVLSAKPGSTIALGLQPGVTTENVRAAIDDNTLESLLNQLPVETGDLIFVDPGTIHAIGPGIVLFEVQQQSDLTYRLYDYGRDRQLHVELGLKALRTETAAGKVPPTTIAPGITRLIENDFFTVIRVELNAGASYALPPASTVSIVVPLADSIAFQCPNTAPVNIGKAHALVIPANATDCELKAFTAATILIANPGPSATK